MNEYETGGLYKYFQNPIDENAIKFTSKNNWVVTLNALCNLTLWWRRKRRVYQYWNIFRVFKQIIYYNFYLNSYIYIENRLNQCKKEIEILKHF